MIDLLEADLEAEVLQEEVIRAVGQDHLEAIEAHLDQDLMAVEVQIVQILTVQVLDFMEDQENLNASQDRIQEVLAAGQGHMEVHLKDLSFQEGGIDNCRCHLYV